MSGLPATLGEALARARGRIAQGDARILLREASGAGLAQLVAFPERALPPEAAARFLAWLARREAGEPVAHLLGEREFYGRRFRVSAATLIPRPDTELLVTLACERLAALAEPAVLDLGTGSGAIAISIALECPGARVSAVDFSAEALAVARANASALGARVTCLHGSWFAPVGAARYACIVSNPPYIAAADPHLAQGDLRFEPLTALASGVDGLDDIRHIVAGAAAHLAPRGWLLLEHGHDQAAAVRRLLDAQGYAGVASWRDLAGIERVTGGHLA
ncbi:MAG: peptide chain release factor N(5)-glutamine methyltransferase [Candidatus Dactylopiibacterium sp.]|nr:peptide chain release factor N(5)-glutamine methyltransferase [Candidatus Dactylopiibacterium sp.]